MIPTISPIFSISFCFTKPVEYAIALGGVDIGKHIAAEADKAIPINMIKVKEQNIENLLYLMRY